MHSREVEIKRAPHLEEGSAPNSTNYVISYTWTYTFVVIKLFSDIHVFKI
jgi:hypothetical protein